jgi:hypothetical protein
MQTFNVGPWELLDLQQKFMQEMREMQDSLRAEKGFNEEHFLALHKPIHGRQPGESTTYADFLVTGTLLGEHLRIHSDTFPSSIPANPNNKHVRIYRISSRIGSTILCTSLRLVSLMMSMI